MAGAISASAAGFVSPVAFSTMRTPAACSKSRPSALISTSTVRSPTTMRELLTPALWACAEPAYVVRQAATANKTSARDTFIAGSAERRDAHAHCKSGGAVLRTLAHTMTPADGSFTAPEILENEGRGRRAHAVRIGPAERRKRRTRFIRIGTRRVRLSRKPGRAREINRMNEGSFLGVVGACGDRGQRFRFGDLAIEIVGAHADELKGIEHEAFVEAGFKQLEARAQCLL